MSDARATRRNPGSLCIVHRKTGKEGLVYFVGPSCQAVEVDNRRYTSLTAAHEAIASFFACAKNKRTRHEVSKDAGWAKWSAKGLSGHKLQTVIEECVSKGMLAEVPDSQERRAIVNFCAGVLDVPSARRPSRAASAVPQRIDQAPIERTPAKILREEVKRMEQTDTAVQSVESVVAACTVGDGDVPNLYALPPSQWTEDVLSRFLRRPGRGEPGTPRDPHLAAVSHFRRNGAGRNFKFLCHWRHPAKPVPLVKTWQRWVDLFQNRRFHQILDDAGWDIGIECGKNYEESREWLRGELSDGEDDYDDIQSWQLPDSEDDSDDSDECKTPPKRAKKTKKQRAEVFRYQVKKLRGSVPPATQVFPQMG